MKLIIDITNEQDCTMAINLIRMNYPHLVEDAPVVVQTPANEPPPHTDVDAPPEKAKQTPPPATEKAKEPAPEQKEEGQPAPDPAPAAKTDGDDITLEQLQGAIRNHLMQFKGDDEKMGREKKALIEILLKTAGVGASGSVPEDKIDAAYAGIVAYTEKF